MDATALLERRRVRSQLLLKTRSSMTAIVRQPSAHSFRTEESTGRPLSSTLNHTFRAKFERILKQKKIKIFLDTQHTEKVSVQVGSTTNEIEKEVARFLKRRSIEGTTARLKHQILRCQNSRKVLADSQLVSEKDVKFVIRKDHRIQFSQQENIHTMKCYQSMKERYHKDLILWKSRYEELQGYYSQYQKTIKQLQTEEYNLLQTHRDVFEMLNSTKSIVQVEAEKKGSTLDDQRVQIQERREYDRWMVEEDRKKEEFKQLAGVKQEKEQIEQYRAYYLTNKFLLRLLKNKSEVLIRRYKKEHDGFSFIRVNTGLNSVNAILERIQVQDQVYDDLLRHISDLEAELKLEDFHKELEGGDSMPAKSGFEERLIDDKIEKLQKVKTERINQMKEVDKLNTLLRDWTTKNMCRMGCGGQIERGKDKGVVQLLESLLSKLVKTVECSFRQTEVRE